MCFLLNTPTGTQATCRLHSDSNSCHRGGHTEFSALYTKCPISFSQATQQALMTIPMGTLRFRGTKISQGHSYDGQARDQSPHLRDVSSMSSSCFPFETSSETLPSPVCDPSDIPAKGNCSSPGLSLRFIWADHIVLFILFPCAHIYLFQALSTLS